MNNEETREQEVYANRDYVELDLPNKFLRPNALVSVNDFAYELQFSPVMAEDFDYAHPVVVRKLSTIINRVSSEVESYIGRPLGKSKHVEKIALSTNPQIVLRHRPIREVISVESGYGVKPEDFMRYTDESSLREGILHAGNILPMTRNSVGFGRYPQYSLKRMTIEYEAGYILPKDATEDNPSDLPSDIIGVVLETSLNIFIEEMDFNRAQGLIQRQEGNVNRIWASSVMPDLMKHGVFSKANQRVLDQYKNTVSAVSI